MKRIALILIASVVAFGSLQAQKKQKGVAKKANVDKVVEAPDTVADYPEFEELWMEASRLKMIYPIGPKYMQPEVYDATVIMNKIAKLFGLKDNVQTEVVRQPESGALVSSLNIIPFVANIDDRMFVEKAPSSRTEEETSIKELIEEAKQAFQSCNISYSCGYLQGRLYGENFSTLIAPGKAIRLLTPNTDEQLVYMEVKNMENPSMRDLYAVKWTVEDAATINGALYFLTNRRPDLIEKDNDESGANVEVKAYPQGGEDWHPSDKIMAKLKFLQGLNEKYDKDIEKLREDYSLTVNNEVKSVIKEQMQNLYYKRHEVIDEMHSIMMKITKQ